ncbi:hypothetical protein [Reticulibacter mediterranei]|uniref:hypothetical protein n=1 Tax=Reticulibacter mediterranei TaxID=2778369 RepID=UPI001C687E8F|nr:hypothetical protein [Reticulibacter mediterranei]
MPVEYLPSACVSFHHQSNFAVEPTTLNLVGAVSGTSGELSTSAVLHAWSDSSWEKRLFCFFMLAEKEVEKCLSVLFDKDAQSDICPI